jgi:uncharacterized repeat protein (TIGR01451 family)
VAALAASLAAGDAARATGTPAGTLIQNTATVTFTTGSSTLTMRSTTNVVKVDQVIGVAVTPLIASPVAIGSASANLSYQVTNTGNGADRFDLTGAPNVAGNAFTTTLQTVAVDSNGNGVYDAGIDTVIANGAPSPTMAPDATIRVFVIVAPSAAAADSQTSQVRLTATSITGSGAAGTVFAGKGVGGVDAIVGLTDGTANALETVQASTAQVTLTKSAQIVDPFGGANALSGALVTYSIVAHTTGSGTATGLTVTDAIPGGTTYLPGTITLNGVGLTDAADGDAGMATSTGISVLLGNVAGGSADRTVTFQVRIN